MELLSVEQSLTRLRDVKEPGSVGLDCHEHLVDAVDR